MANGPINFDRIGARRYSKPTVLIGNVKLLSHDKLEWLSTRIKIPESNIPGAIVCLDNEIYIFGGDKLGRRTLQLNEESMNWEKTTRMNSRRKNISNSSVAYAGCIWACGGFGMDYKLNTLDRRERNEVLDSVEKYDPKKSRWITQSPMREQRENAAAAVCGGKLFICGGWDGERHLRSVEYIEASVNLWMSFEKLPSPLWGHAMVFDGTQLIVMGGCFTQNHVVWGIEPRYDGSARWKELKPMNAIKLSLTAMCLSQYNEGSVIVAIEREKVEIFDGKDWKGGPPLSNGSRKTALAITPCLAEILDESDREDSWKRMLIAERFRIRRENCGWPNHVPTILVFGGEDSRDMYILNENAVEWIKLDLQSPESVFMGGAVFLHDSIYIFGGHDLDKKTYRFCVNGSNWIPCGEMNTTRYFISNSSVVFGDDIWVLGGFNGTQTLNTVEKYDSQKNTWEIVRSMNEKREKAAAVEFSGRIFVCGGFDGEYPLDSTEWYDPTTGSWQIFYFNLPSPRSGHVLLVAYECFFLMGGPGDDVLKSVWRPQGRMLRDHRSLSAAYDQDDPDFGPNLRLRRGHRYDEDDPDFRPNLRSVWRSQGRMLRSRTSFTAALLEGKPFAIGGIGLREVELYGPHDPDFGPDLPNEYCNTPSLYITSHFLRNTFFPPKKG